MRPGWAITADHSCPGRKRAECCETRPILLCMGLFSRFCQSTPTDPVLAAREAGEFLDHAFIDRALERNDQVREIFHRFPAPVHEFGLVSAAGTRNVDFSVLAGKAYREPFLSLPAVAALPGASCHGAWNVVDQPIRDFAEFLHRADAGFLVKLALGGLPGVLAGIDAALRHLPDMGFIDMLDAAGAAANEDQPGRIDQHHADAGPVWQVLVARHVPHDSLACIKFTRNWPVRRSPGKSGSPPST